MRLEPQRMKAEDAMRSDSDGLEGLKGLAALRSCWVTGYQAWRMAQRESRLRH